MRGNGPGSVWIRGSGSVWIRVPTGGSHVRSLWTLILTLAYITKRLSEEERKEHDLVGGQTALLIYLEGRGSHTSNPLPFPGLSSRVCLLHQPSLALGYHLLSSAAYYRLQPPAPPRPPTTGFYGLRHLVRLWALTTGFHRLPPPCALLGRDNCFVGVQRASMICTRLFVSIRVFTRLYAFVHVCSRLYVFVPIWTCFYV